MSVRRWNPLRLRPWTEVAFVRSSGPGGQNVNKVSTRVILLFDFESCPDLDAVERSRIRRRLVSRLSRDGRLRVSASRERTQARNRAAAEMRLVELIEGAIAPRKPRAATRPTSSSIHRRLSEKKHRGLRKRDRREKTGDD